jgi:3-dehydroquinate synthase
MMAVELSHRAGWLSAAELVQIESLFVRAGLPVFGPALGAGRYLELMAHDKKVEAGRLRLVLLRGLGHAAVETDIVPEAIHAAIEARCQ